MFENALIEQFRIMEQRLWLAITWPSSILALAFGLGIFITFQLGSSALDAC